MTATAPVMKRSSWIAVVAVLFVARAAHAQSAEATSLFDDGDRLMARGQLAAACDSFEGSNRAEPRAGTLIRLGECREMNHQLASAWSAYKDALTRAKDPRKRDIAAAKAAELEAQLSYLIVSIPDESRVDGLVLTKNGAPLDPSLWNRAVPIDGGTYTIGGRAPGHEEWKTTAIVPQARGKVSVDVPKFKELAKLVKPTPVTSPIDAPPRSTRAIVELSLAGSAAVALAAGITLGVQATDRRHQAQSLCPDPATSCADAPAANALSSSARSRAIGADVAFGVAGAAAIAAGIVWWSGRSVAIAPSVSRDQVGLAAVARW